VRVNARAGLTTFRPQAPPDGLVSEVTYCSVRGATAVHVYAGAFRTHSAEDEKAHAKTTQGVAVASSTLRTAIIVVTASLLSSVAGTRAQEMEPRAFSAVPIGTNFLVAGYARTTGAVSLDPSLPISDVHASINTGLLGYSRTFGLFGHSANLGIVLPYVDGEVSGKLVDQSQTASRSGLGDLRLRFAANLFGGPALTPAEFAQREPTTTLGVSLTIVAPTGDYNPTHLINIGSNRWALKPEIGLSQPLGNWFAEATTGVWVFTDNTAFFNGNVRGQDPIVDFQLHGGYNFRPGLWLAADATYYVGGETSVNGVGKHDLQANSRYGLTLSVPLPEGFSVKLAWSNWFTTRAAGNFETVGATLQYRWFDD
jgi:hypothetical protein